MLALMHNYNESYYKPICNSCFLKCFVGSGTSVIKQKLAIVAIQKPAEHTTSVKPDTNGASNDHSNHSDEEGVELEEGNGSKHSDQEQLEMEMEEKNIEIVNLKLILTNNNSMVVPIGSDIHLTPPPVVDDDYEYDDDRRRESMRTTLSDAQIVTALKPIQKGVKRFIDNEREIWSPIRYKYKPDNASILKPKNLQLRWPQLNPL
eukprot:UN05317